MKGLVKLYHWWYNNMQQGQFGGKIQFIFAFYYTYIVISPYFLKFSSVLMNMQIR